MGFINVESRGVNYRVLLGTHKLTTPGSQLSRTTSAAVVEGGYNKPPVLYNIFEGKPLNPTKRHVSTRDPDADPFLDFLDIRSDAVQKGYPLVAGEPLVDAQRSLEMHSQRNDRPKTVLELLAVSILVSLAASEDEVKEGSLRYRLAVLAANRFIKKDLMPHRLKDKIFAQRAESFANEQLRIGMVPDLAIALGSLHIGVVKELQTDPQERAWEIKNDPKISYYQTDKLHVGHYTQFNSRRRAWERKTFNDPALKMI